MMDRRKLKAIKTKERKAFESWLNSINGHKFSADDRRKDGQYYSIAYENAWQGWLARALLPSPPSPTEEPKA